MFLDDDLDQKTGKAKPRDLTNMSVAELEEYKQDLLGEVKRVEADMEKKNSHKASVDALFGSKE